MRLLIPEELFESVSIIPLDLAAGRSKFFWVDPTTVLDSSPTTVDIGFVVGGELTLGRIEANDGGRVELSFKTPLVTLKKVLRWTH